MFAEEEEGCEEVVAVVGEAATFAIAERARVVVGGGERERDGNSD